MSAFLSIRNGESSITEYNREMDLERPQYKLERCDGIFCELSPEDKARWIEATKEGRKAIEKEHCTKNGLRWGIEEDDDGELFVPPAFGAERILSENNPDYSEMPCIAPLTAPLIGEGMAAAEQAAQEQGAEFDMSAWYLNWMNGDKNNR